MLVDRYRYEGEVVAAASFIAQHQQRNCSTTFSLERGGSDWCAPIADLIVVSEHLSDVVSRACSHSCTAKSVSARGHPSFYR